MKTRFTLFASLFFFSLYANEHPDYGNESQADFLSPAYYNAATDDSLRLAINEIIYLTRQETLHHPLLGEDLPSYTIFRDFAEVVGRNGNFQYHPARDFYVENKTTTVNIYASHDGIYDTSRSISRYRHNISITAPITNNAGEEIAKLTTIYAHVDLDLNTVNIEVGDSVKRGDLICSHLYSGTMGGPHLHYEIRFYHNTAKGNEEFYAWNFNTPSSGPWVYGAWDTEVGIGYGHPDNYLSTKASGLQSIADNQCRIFPNPFNQQINIHSPNSEVSMVELYNTQGQKVAHYPIHSTNSNINTVHLSEGIYFMRILSGIAKEEYFPLIKKL